MPGNPNVSHGVDDPVDVDVAVVGAGPAGSAAALRLAEQGLQVALIERAEQPGAKNLSGGVLYPATLAAAVPGFADQAPFERRVVRNVTTLLTPESSVSLDYADQALACGQESGSPNAVTVLRAKFDPWLAGRAEAAGAFLMPGMLVESLAFAPAPQAPGGRRVVGVVASGQTMRAHAVVLADGVNSFLARGAGLRPAPPPAHVGLGVKAVLALPAEQIEARFGVSPGQGAAHSIVGDATLGVAGGAFLYTNTDSLSLGVVLRLDDLVSSGRSARAVFDHLLTHPGLRRYLEGASVIEYGSHLVAEGGLAGVGRIAWPGCVVVGDAAGLTLNSGLVLRGMDLGITSGLVAADVVGRAVRERDPAAVLDYPRALADSPALADLATHAGMVQLLQRRGPYGPWGQAAQNVLRSVYTIGAAPVRPLRSLVRSGLRSQSWRTWLGDARAIWRAL